VRIIFVTIAYPRSNSESNLYSDLMLEFAEHAHEVFVVSSIEKRFNKDTKLEETNGIKLLRVQTGNITANPNLLSKGISLLQFQYLMIKAIRNYFSHLTFDLIIYSTPPIQYNRIITYLTKKTGASTYLLLKDIFPQNAIDLGLIKKWNPVYWYFRIKEKQTYRLSDRIGCMSTANMNYILQHNKFLKPERVEVCPNSHRLSDRLDENQRKSIRIKVRQTYSLPNNDLLLIYGGNLGIAQGLGFLIMILQAYKDIQKVKFLIVGDGTEYHRIENHLKSNQYHNVLLLKRVSTDDFREFVIASDIGLIFLDPRFTIPNFPSRLNSYLEFGLPVIACTDKISDVGNILEENKCGFKVISGDIQRFITLINNLIQTPEELIKMSSRSRKLFEDSYTTKKAYSTIMAHQIA